MTSPFHLGGDNRITVSAKADKTAGALEGDSALRSASTLPRGCLSEAGDPGKYRGSTSRE